VERIRIEGKGRRGPGRGHLQAGDYQAGNGLDVSVTITL